MGIFLNAEAVSVIVSGGIAGTINLANPAELVFSTTAVSFVSAQTTTPASGIEAYPTQTLRVHSSLILKLSGATMSSWIGIPAHNLRDGSPIRL